MIPSNAIQKVIQGGTPLLPSSEKWRSVALRSGEILAMSSEDFKCCFYVYRPPPAWRPYFALSLPVRRKALGLSGEGSVYLTPAVVPMSWVSATGVIQHVHRYLLRHWRAGVPAPPADRELRRDVPVPGRGGVVVPGGPAAVSG
eukprot:7912411-Pyramimonas_sp.AAC.1